MPKAIGIDLGTTNSAMAIVDETGRPKMIANKEGKHTTPSVILFRGKERIVGERAKGLAVAQAENIAMLMKRHMCEVDWKYIDDNDKSYTPEELSALILKKLKQDAAAGLGEEITKAVITVPAYFEDLERSRTKDAGRIAGLEVLRLINEPTAAAFAYGIKSTGQKLKVLVYDLGGGTFDVTVMDVDGSDINMVTTTGNKILGGADFDRTLAKYFADEFQETHGLDPFEKGLNLKVYQDFMDKAERAKFDLSSDTETYITLTAAGKVLDLTLSRDKFNSLIKHYVDETIDLTGQALKDASLSWPDIDKILLVGGSTRIPMVQEELRRVSGKELESGINPDEIVALGAAVMAASEIGEKIVDPTGGALPPPSIIDATAASLGIVAVDVSTAAQTSYNSIIIKKDSKLPAQGKERYSTVADNQTRVEIQVLQGEQRDPKDCTKVGEAHQLTGIPPMKKGEPDIEVQMQYDKEGIIHVFAKELKSGVDLKVDIKDPNRLSDEQIEQKKAETAQLQVK